MGYSIEQSIERRKLHKVYTLFRRKSINSDIAKYILCVHEESGILAEDCKLKYIGFSISLSDDSLEALANKVADEKKLRIEQGDEIITLSREITYSKEGYSDCPLSEKDLYYFRDAYIGIEEDILRKLADKRIKQREDVTSLRENL